MYTLSVENTYGDILELTNNPAYCISNVDGIDPPEATINTARNAGADGSVFNSAYMNNRTITITMAINGPAEANRIELYRYFKSRFPLRLHYSNGSRSVYIDGYIQSMQIAFFDQKQTAQIVIECPQPLFNGSALSVQEFSNVQALFEFPFSIPQAGIQFSEILPYVEKSIINDGDVETGVVIEVKAVGPVVNPKIYDVDTNESFILNMTMSEGDLITINTRRGEKSVKLTSGGVTTNIVGYLQDGSTWFNLLPGDNVFTTNATANPENMLVTFTIINQYEGV